MSESPRNGRHGVRYVRRKPGKNVFVLYNAAAGRARSNGSDDVLCVTLDESELGPVDGSTLSVLFARLDDVSVDGEQVVVSPGITVRRLSDDPALPALHAAWNPAPGDEFCSALEAMLSSGPITRVTAVPRHYKPKSRCVIEYQVKLGDGTKQRETQRVVYGKMFTEATKAVEVDAALRRVTAAWAPGGPLRSWSPRPLGVYAPFAMSVSEAANAPPPLRSGLTVLRPSKGGQGAMVVPCSELDVAADALALLHSSTIAEDELAVRDGAAESARALERGELLASFQPDLSGEINAVARRTAAALASLRPAKLQPCHGSYKRSQLVYARDGSLVVVDWDSMCLADPALDLGCFIAHLRPAALWYQRQAARRWFEAAARHWTTAYMRAMSERGVGRDEICGIVDRRHAYEAAMLLKMATRRLRRLNSPRPGELRAILEEADRCLGAHAAA